ncbi:pentatricopeptide repeat-containing protein At1g74850, chloroplastic isoform X1 [Nymphaea colorata]|nr:pentatricopeptide repeat-containing protein At1g74850, chloroplastic isoform X1 [Nymphaea colorata]
MALTSIYSFIPQGTLIKPSLSPNSSLGSSFFPAFSRNKKYPSENSPSEWGFSTSRSHGRSGLFSPFMARARPKEVILGNPSVTVEKGKYSYDVETLINKLSSLPPRGSIARCLDIFKNKLSLNDFALVFKEFAQRGDWQRSLRLFKYMQRQIWCKPNEHIYTIMIGILGREGLLEKCSEVFEEMPNHGVSWSVFSFTALINAYGRNGQYETSLQLLARMKREKIAPSLLTYNTVINSCARGGLDWEGLLGLFAQMRHEGIQPDLVTYNTLLNACGRRGLGDEAEMVFRTMNEAGIVPDVTTHTYLVEAFGKLNKLEKVSELLREMELAGNLPDVSSYNVLLEAHSQSGSINEAMGVFRQMQKVGCAPNASTYSILLNLYGRYGRYDEVRDLFLEMKVSSTEPDAATYNILIDVFGEGGYFNEVVTLFHDMVEEKVDPNMETYEGLIFACGKGGLYEDARKILLHMQSNGIVPSAGVYNGVIEAYGQAALYEEALVAFNTMQEVGSLPTIETYNSLIAMFGRGGLYREAQAIVSHMNESEIQRNEDSFNGLIESFTQNGKYENALTTYMEMQRARCTPNERSLEAILNVYCSAGLVEESKEQFLAIKESGVMPSVISYCQLVSVYAKNERWTEAYEVLDEMRTSRVSNAHQVIGTMIKGEYDDESNWQMVEYVFAKVKCEGCAYGLRFYNALLDALWWLGQKARAARVLQEAIKHGLYPELFRCTKLLWSVDVHRMSIGGSLTAVSVWSNDICNMMVNAEELPELATVVVVRGDMEKTADSRVFPVANAVYTYLRNQTSSCFSFAPWSNGRIVSQQSQFKKLLSLSKRPEDRSTKKVLIPLIDIDFPRPGTKAIVRDSKNDLKYRQKRDADDRTETELLAAAA